MTTRTPALTAAAAALLATLAGCSTPSSGASPIGTCTTCGTSNATTSPADTATSSTAITAATPSEQADRAAAEATWRRVDELAITMQSMPADQVVPALAAVAVDPILSRLQAQNTQFRAQGKVGYGRDVSHITWPQPIAGRNTAVLDDCQDGSQSGYLDAKTGNKLTVGTPNTPIKVTLTRTPEGWKVASADLVKGATCTPGS